MGRGTQLFDYLTRETHPTKLQIQHYYTGITITDKLKKLRREYQKGLKMKCPDCKSKQVELDDNWYRCETCGYIFQKRVCKDCGQIYMPVLKDDDFCCPSCARY